MNYKKLSIIILTISLVMIVSGCVSSFIISLKADRREIYSRMDVVKDEFEVFSANTSVFESFRDELYTVVLDNVYFDSFYSDDEIVKDKLSNYEQLVDELTKNTKNLENLCENVYYPDGGINSRCNNYKLIYEQVVNYFVGDIELYNSHVVKYNKDQESKNTLFRVKKYNTDKDYVDYNHDKVFDGKEK